MYSGKMSSSELSNFLSEYKLNRSAIVHRPRGLVKTQTSSYLNCIVQALLHIPQFFNLLNELRNLLAETDEKIKIIKAFSELADFDQNLTEHEIFRGAKYCLRTVRVSKLLNKVIAKSKGFFQKDVEEDPGKFLGYLINAMRCEISSACEGVNPIQEIFQGTIEFKLENQKTVNFPFFILPLDVSGDHIITVSDALNEFFNVKRIGKKFSKLPEVLILHINLFSLDETTGKLQKRVKNIETSQEIDIPHAMLSENANYSYTSFQKRYILSSIIYHQQEKTSNNAHYTALVEHDTLGFLVYDDDTMIDYQKGGGMLLSPSDINPYLFMFRRKDTIAPFSDENSQATDMDVSEKVIVEYIHNHVTCTDFCEYSPDGKYHW